jgi:thioredoxin-related protein
MKSYKALFSITLIGLMLFPAFAFKPQEEKKKEGIKWLTIEEAYALNQKKPKKIFVDVYTDWCGWCKHMDRTTFADATVAEYTNKNFYAVKLNAESNTERNMGGSKMTERDIARSFKVGSYPTIVFIHEDFKTIMPMPGYRDANGFLTMLKQFNENPQQKN